MDFLTSKSQLLLEKSMEFLWTKQAAILDNIANAETPNYKAKVVTFEDSLRAQLERRLTSAGAASVRSGTAQPAGRVSTSSIRQVIQDAQPYVFEAQEQTRMDDNGVNTTDQMVELIRNAYQQQYVYQAISKHYSILQTAVRG